MPQLSSIIGEAILNSKVSLTSEVSQIVHSVESVQPGDLFFAISGTKVDGHSFVEEALRRGALAVVVEKREVFDRFSEAILVSSTRKSLAQAAAFFFKTPSSAFPVVGITGTNGKTTTTFLLEQVWSHMGLKTGLIGTVETRIGSRVLQSELTTPGPIELQRLFSEMRGEKVDAVAMEVSSIALEQYRTAGTQFKVVAFTNFTQDHLDYHGNLQNYFESKRRLFTDYDAPVAVINIDDPRGIELIKKTTAKKIISISTTKQSDFRVLESRFDKSGTWSKIQTPTGVKEIQLSMIGEHNLMNVLTVLGVTHGLGQDEEKTISVLKVATGAPGRLERVSPKPGVPNIFVDYAHSDDALKNVLGALHHIRTNSSGRIITVFGCGGDRDKTKRSKMAEVVSRFSDVTVATSDNPRTENPDSILDDIEKGIQFDKTRYHRDADRRKAIYWALENATSDDLVLVAGKGHETYQIIGHEKFPFDDKAVIRDYYS